MNEENEINQGKEKKKINFGIILIFIFEAVILIAILLTTGTIRLNNFNPITDNDKNEAKHEEKSKAVDLDIQNGKVVSLFNNVHYNYGLGPDQYVFNNSKFSVDDMDENYKFGLASNLLKKEQYYQEVRKIAEEDIKEAYENIFGPKTYKSVEKFNLGCGDYVYDATTKNYVNSASGCGGATSFIEAEAIIGAKKYDDRIEIVSAVAYLENNVIYRDYNKTNKIKDITANDFANTVENPIKEQYEKYVRENSKYLEQYTYTFKLNEDGFYYYTGVERTQK